MPYRYATSALLGPWRATEAEAIEDAIRACLAVRSGNAISWRVAGWIERGGSGDETGYSNPTDTREE